MLVIAHGVVAGRQRTTVIPGLGNETWDSRRIGKFQSPWHIFGDVMGRLVVIVSQLPAKEEKVGRTTGTTTIDCNQHCEDCHGVKSSDGESVHKNDSTIAFSKW